MKKHLFHISTHFASGVEWEDIVELPNDLTDEEVEAEFKEWIWEQLDAFRYEIK